ncbi:alpha/beta hydrolase [Marichromatium bheemlicum]|uniref:alpha/beta hydrolase n=1 Tax=Marichromatium bheemlicum TaxID=365339 RepID=UPI0031B59DC1
MSALLADWLTAPWRLALESRAGAEFVATLISRQLCPHPRGDAHPVLIFPRLFGGAAGTAPLRHALDELGYTCIDWGQGINRGPRPGVFAACAARLDRLHRHHRRRVSLIGWSLGGLYARELAKAHPEQVRQVITLATPIAGYPDPAQLWRLHQALSGEPIGLDPSLGPLATPPPVPTTALISRSDGIVAWHTSHQPPAPNFDPIEIPSSHLGMIYHPLALDVIADRLAQPEDDWRPFARTGARALLYPAPSPRTVSDILRR